MKKHLLFSVAVASLVATLAGTLSAGASTSNETWYCSTMQLVSGSGTKTAGYTSSNPVGSPTNVANYSDGSFVPATVVPDPVIPPWVNPSTDPNFAGSGAVWVNDSPSFPGQDESAGDPTADQWRL